MTERGTPRPGSADARTGERNRPTRGSNQAGRGATSALGARNRGPAAGDRRPDAAGTTPDGPAPAQERLARSGTRATDDTTGNKLPEQPTADKGPAAPTDLDRRSWWGVLKRTVVEFQRDNLTDWAAALTYYGVLSLFPGMLLLVSALRLTGPKTTQKVIDNMTALAPGPVRDLLRGAAENLRDSRPGTAGILAVAGLAGALWSASGYIGAFMRASNAIYDVPEGRPVWKTLPIRLGITVLAGVMLSAIALAVVLTGGFARQLGELVGVGTGVVRVWDIAKWPVLLIAVSLLIAVLYWASPNAKHGFRWISPGGALAVVVWLIASAGFALYVANFASYNKTYGALGGMVIFLVWLWISNIAVLLGAEFEAELQRGRAIEAGHRPEDEPYLQLRDTRKIDEEHDPDLS
jgi:membrane protein